ncbi:hypothetical protein PROPEN_01031 [Proteus penneri ATCC 35198]|nr:hypothetical protein PROPEN_01031 [Proteus penneri ATCC 35198]
MYLTEHKNILLFTATETICYLIHFFFCKFRLDSFLFILSSEMSYS